MDEPDRDGVEEVQLLPALPSGDDEPGLLELLQVLHHPEARHVEARFELVERLAVLAEELVEQAPPGGVGQRLEHLVHTAEDR